MAGRTGTALETMLDCFTGADGGASFMQLRVLVEEMERRASTGDAAAEEVMLVVERFARMITYASKRG